MELITKLFDSGTFAEMGSLIPNSNVVCGYGVINDSIVFAYEQKGIVNLAQANKIAKLYEDALKADAPVIAILNSEGLSLDEGFECLNAYGKIFAAQSNAHGVIPQVAITTGNCMGTASFTVGMSDFLFKLKGSNVFCQSPNMYGNSINGITSSLPMSMNDCDEETVVSSLRQLILYFDNSIAIQDDLNREDSDLATMTLDEEAIGKLFSSISDGGKFLDFSGTSKTLKIGLAQLDGQTTGLVGITGNLSTNAITAIVKFVEFCDAFSFPVVTFSNIEGLDTDSSCDNSYIQNASILMRVLRNSSCARINVILKSTVGAGYFVFNSHHTGNDLTLMWETGKINLLNEVGGDKVIKKNVTLSANDAASHGFVDFVINPSATRKRVINGIGMIKNKKSSR